MNSIQILSPKNGIVLATSAERELWRYHHLPVAGGQPCFHPVNTPAGYTISLLSPWDHVHHTGLWFGWKLIDGLNTWEGPAYAPFETKIKATHLDLFPDGFGGSYTWCAGEKQELLTGRVVCKCSWLDATAYALDLDYEFSTPGNQPVILDRNPPPAAGYAGLSIRTIREFRHGSYVDADGRSEPAPRGTPVAWHAYSGPIDGGPGRKGGVALMDHPRNPRFPAPTYSIHESEAFGFLQYAFLYHEPYTLYPNRSLHLRYRIAVFDGDANAPKIQEWFNQMTE